MSASNLDSGAVAYGVLMNLNENHEPSRAQVQDMIDAGFTLASTASFIGVPRERIVAIYNGNG